MSSEWIGALVEQLRKREHAVMQGPAYLQRMCETAATALVAQEAEIAALRKLVKDAFNEGFHEGMREYTTSRGGNNWQSSKARAALTRKEG